MTKMDPKVKTLWTTALRSGEHKKGRSQLKDLDGRLDAAGVLVELAVSMGIIPEGTRYDEGDPGNEAKFFGYMYKGDDDVFATATGLPKAVEKWAGLSYGRAWRIAMKGDKGMSFNDIADYIDKTL